MSICCAECNSNYYNKNKEFVCKINERVIIHNPPLNLGEEIGDVPCWCPKKVNHV